MDGPGQGARGAAQANGALHADIEETPGAAEPVDAAAALPLPEVREFNLQQLRVELQSFRDLLALKEASGGPQFP